jgi:hypothetical protein
VSGAVFVSYASQDAEAAQRLCGALRSVGVEVWFDQSELVGGDAWDAKIRAQIPGVRAVHACHICGDPIAARRVFPN